MNDIRPSDSLNKINIPTDITNKAITNNLEQKNQNNYKELREIEKCDKAKDKQAVIATLRASKTKPFEFGNYQPVYKYFLRYQYRTLALWLALITIVIAIVVISFAAMTNVKIVSLFSSDKLWVSTKTYPTIFDAWSKQSTGLSSNKINDLFNMQIIPEEGLAITTFIFATLSIVTSIALVSTSKKHLLLAPTLLMTSFCLLIINVILLIILAPHINNFNEIKTTASKLQEMVFTLNSKHPEKSELNKNFNLTDFNNLYNHLLSLLK